MNMTTFKPFLLLISLLALALTSSSTPLRDLSKGDDRKCFFYLTIQTSTLPNAGTTSNVSITVGDVVGNRVVIPNVVDWNITKPEPGHDPFQRGNVDKFVGREECSGFASHICFISVTITGTGHNPNWLPDYVDVNTVYAGKLFFGIGEGLTPYNNNVVRNLCPLLPKGKTSFTKGSLAT